MFLLQLVPTVRFALKVESHRSPGLRRRVELLKSCLQRECHMILISLKLLELSHESTHVQPVFPLACEETTVSWVENHMKELPYV